MGSIVNDDAVCSYTSLMENASPLRPLTDPYHGMSPFRPLFDRPLFDPFSGSRTRGAGADGGVRPTAN